MVSTVVFKIHFALGHYRSIQSKYLHTSILSLFVFTHSPLSYFTTFEASLIYTLRGFEVHGL